MTFKQFLKEDDFLDGLDAIEANLEDLKQARKIIVDRCRFLWDAHHYDGQGYRNFENFLKNEGFSEYNISYIAQYYLDKKFRSPTAFRQLVTYLQGTYK